MCEFRPTKRFVQLSLFRSEYLKSVGWTLPVVSVADTYNNNLLRLTAVRRYFQSSPTTFYNEFEFGIFAKRKNTSTYVRSTLVAFENKGKQTFRFATIQCRIFTEI